MDSLKLKAEIDEMKKLGQHYEKQLKLIGIDACELKDEILAMLDDCVALQQLTGVSCLEEHILKEFYVLKKKEQIDNNRISTNLEMDIEKLEKEIQETKIKNAALEKFITNTGKRLTSEDEMRRNKFLMETQIKGLQDKLTSLSIPEDLAIMDMIAKVETLKQHHKPKAK